MVNKVNVSFESELYEPMRLWLHQYLSEKYKGFKIISIDSHSERLDKVLAKFNVNNEFAIGLDIQIDIVGIAQKQNVTKIFFIEAKKTNLTIRDLGQLWAYCKFVDPDEAFLLTSTNLGSLDKILNIFKREDLLDFGNGKIIKKMRVGVWNINAKYPELGTLIPKL